MVRCWVCHIHCTGIKENEVALIYTGTLCMEVEVIYRHCVEDRGFIIVPLQVLGCALCIEVLYRYSFCLQVEYLHQSILGP